MQGYDISFETYPITPVLLKNKSFSEVERGKISCEVDRLLDIGAISTIDCADVKFSSPLFLVPKPDGKTRLILNLKRLNMHISRPHFKMEDYRAVCNLIRKGNFMTKIDLKDAYLSVPVSSRSSKFLCFCLDSNFYCYKALPFGLCTSPYVFTKLMRPVVRFLRESGVKLVMYLDDILILADSIEKCAAHTERVVETLIALGFTINWEKSIRLPGVSIEYLGFIFDSQQMKVSLPQRKREKLFKMIQQAIKFPTNTLQHFMELQGTLVSACPAIGYSLLFTRSLARLIATAVKMYGDNQEVRITLDSSCLKDLKWWADELQLGGQNIRQDSFDKVIFTDASLSGYGGDCDGKSISGHWTVDELAHINELEMMAIEKCLKYFCQNDSDIQILLRVDSRTAICYINRFGGVHSSNLHTVAKRIWQWAMDRNIYLVSSYISSKENSKADAESRRELRDLDWRLDSKAFAEIVRNFGEPTIDLFASEHSAQVTRYVSLLPDINRVPVDAFTVSWKDEWIYIPTVLFNPSRAPEDRK